MPIYQRLTSIRASNSTRATNGLCLWHNKIQMTLSVCFVLYVYMRIMYFVCLLLFHVTYMKIMDVLKRWHLVKYKNITFKINLPISKSASKEREGMLFDTWRTYRIEVKNIDHFIYVIYYFQAPQSIQNLMTHHPAESVNWWIPIQIFNEIKLKIFRCSTWAKKDCPRVVFWAPHSTIADRWRTLSWLVSPPVIRIHKNLNSQKAIRMENKSFNKIVLMILMFVSCAVSNREKQILKTIVCIYCVDLFETWYCHCAHFSKVNNCQP